MTLNAYLNFAGKCEEAFNFYHKVLGGDIVALVKGSDMPMPAEGDGEGCAGGEWDPNMIMHARLIVDGQILMGSDAPPQFYEKPQGTTVNINVETIEEAERIFAALSENGEVKIPIAETFWAHRWGLLVDQYGTPWMLNCEKPMG